MKLGIFAKTFAGNTPHGVMTAAAAAGYRTVQYNMACSGVGALPEKIDAIIVENIRQSSLQTDVEVAAVSATYNMAHPDVATRRAGRRSFAAIAGAAKSMGTNVLTVCSGSRDAEDQWRWHPDNDVQESWRDMLAEFETLIGIAEQHDVIIGVEPELANIVSSAQKARLMLDSLKSSRIKIVLDPANLFETTNEYERRTIIAEAIDLLGENIIMAHAKDRDAKGGFVAAGKGVVDFPHFLSCLRRVGFEGNVVTHGLTEAEAPEVASFLKSMLA